MGNMEYIKHLHMGGAEQLRSGKKYPGMAGSLPLRCDSKAEALQSVFHTTTISKSSLEPWVQWACKITSSANKRAMTSDLWHICMHIYKLPDLFRLACIRLSVRSLHKTPYPYCGQICTIW